METTLSAEQVLEGNRMIAEFMGAIHGISRNSFGKEVAEFMDYIGCDIRPDDREYQVWMHHIFYHTSWDWLMPVLDRIEKHGCIIEISYALVCNCRIVAINGKAPSVTFINDNNGGKPTVEAVYKTVIEFIKWHKQY